MLGFGLKKRAATLMRRLGFEIIKLNEKPRIEDRNGLNLLDLYCERAASQLTRRLRLIQIGANDGDTNDPVKSVITHGIVDAVLVEPIPVLYKLLSCKYYDNNNVTVMQYAVAKKSGKLKFYIAMKDKNTMADSSIASMDRKEVVQHIENRRKIEPDIFGISPFVKEIIVDTLTIEELVEKIDWDYFDVLVIDAEGQDFDIVSELLNTEYRPLIIQMEYANMSNVQFKEIRKKLKSRDYFISISGLDIFAVHRDLIKDYAQVESIS